MTVEATPTPGRLLISPTITSWCSSTIRARWRSPPSRSSRTAAHQRVAGRHAAQVFGVDTILTTVAAESFSGPIFTEITDTFPNHEVIDRTTMNTWEDGRITNRINQIGKKRLVLAGSVDRSMHCRPGAFGTGSGVRGLLHRRRLR